MVVADMDTPPPPPLRRGNSVPSAVLLPHRKHKTTPPTISNGNHHHRSPPSSFTVASDFELIPLKSTVSDSYTSLKDILPSSSSPNSILSPTPAATLAGISSSSSGGGSGYEISIRNRLVKQAAWAYLQPAVLSSSSPSSSSSAFRRFFALFDAESLRPIFSEFRRGVTESLTRFHDWLVDALWLILCR